MVQTAATAVHSSDQTVKRPRTSVVVISPWPPMSLIPLNEVSAASGDRQRNVSPITASCPWFPERSSAVPASGRWSPARFRR